MSDPIVGQPWTVTAVITKPDRTTELDPAPARVVFTWGPEAEASDATAAWPVDPTVTTAGDGKTFTLSVIPNRPGTWWVDVDAFDSQGVSVAAGQQKWTVAQRRFPQPA
jgi:hypothetical protein